MFPGQNNSIKDNAKNNSSEIYSNGKSFLFDFNSGEFKLQDGKLSTIEKLEALKSWINKILRTDKNKYEIYKNTSYGVENLKDLLTSNYPFEFIKAEIERSVKEILLKNKNIKSVERFEFERNNRLLKVSFNVISNFGLIESEVSI